MLIPLILITFTNIFVAGMICREILHDKAYNNPVDPYAYLWFVLNFFCGIILMISLVGKAYNL